MDKFYLDKIAKYREGAGYSIEGHKIYTGDATNIEDIKTLCGDVKPTLAVCDPPYGIGIEEWDEFSLDDYILFTEKWIENLIAVMDPGALYIWITQKWEMVYHVWNLLRDFEALKFQRELVLEMNKINAEKSNWPLNEQRCLYYLVKGGKGFERQETDIKKNVSFGKREDRNRIAGSLWNRHDIPSVWFKDSEHVDGCNIALQKPVKALKRIIQASSVEGDVVIDLFCHSGSTLAACGDTKRVCLTLDFDKKYIEIATTRYWKTFLEQRKLF